MERGGGVRGFLPVCIQSKCSMSKKGFITTPKKRDPSHKHEIPNVQQGQNGQAMLFCTTNYFTLPLRDATKDRRSKTKTKPCISQNVIHPMKLLLPVHLSDELGEVTKTEERVFVGVSGCQVQNRRILCQVLLNRQKKSPSKKVSTERQHKGHIHHSTKDQSWTETAKVSILCPSYAHETDLSQRCLS